jgi:hypothetical protein
LEKLGELTVTEHTAANGARTRAIGRERMIWRIARRANWNVETSSNGCRYAMVAEIEGPTAADNTNV